jgi:hypothetical protein
MLTNARDNEEKGKERNADLLKSIEKMERKLAATGADMTRLKDAQVGFQIDFCGRGNCLSVNYCCFRGLSKTMWKAAYQNGGRKSEDINNKKENCSFMVPSRIALKMRIYCFLVHNQLQSTSLRRQFQWVLVWLATSCYYLNTF